METLAPGKQLTIPPRGRLSKHGIVGLLGLMGLVRATGVLDVTSRRLRRRLVLQNGTVVAHVSNAVDDRLLEWAVAAGRLDLEKSRLEALKERLGDSPLAARVLVEEGVVDGPEMPALLADQARCHVREMTGWADGEFEISPGKVKFDGEPTAELPALGLALELGRETPAPGAPRAVAPLTVLATWPLEDLDEALFTEEERSVLESCRKPLRRDELAATLPEIPAEVLNSTVTSLWRSGLLKGAGRKAIGKIDSSKYDAEVTRDEIESFLAAAEAGDFETLIGVPAGAEPAEIRRAYYRTVRRLHPDRFRQGPYSEFHAAIEQAFRAVHEALSVLSDPDRQRAALKKASRKSDPELLARGYLAQARKATMEGRRADALMLLESALQQVPDHVELQLRRGLLLAGNPMRREDACRLLEQLSVEYPDRADLLAAAGLALSAAQRDAEAETMQRRAWTLDPDDPIVLALSGDAKALRTLRKDPFVAPLLSRKTG